MLCRIADNDPESVFKSLLERASTYNEQQRNEVATEIVNDPYRLAMVPRLKEILSIGPAYPQIIDAMRLEVENDKGRLPFEDV